MIIRRIRDIFQAFRCSERKTEPVAVENAGKTSPLLPVTSPPFMAVDLPHGVRMYCPREKFAAACERWAQLGAVYFPEAAPPRLDVCECSMRRILWDPLVVLGEDQFGPSWSVDHSGQWGRA